jgi:hypothetical protein
VNGGTRKSVPWRGFFRYDRVTRLVRSPARPTRLRNTTAPHPSVASECRPIIPLATARMMMMNDTV